MTQAPPNVSSLHRITRLPLDLTHPIFRRYPSAKLGVRESTRHYATLLAPLAAQILASAPHGAPWVLTAPALIYIPAAANYICRHLLQCLKPVLPRGFDLTLVEIEATRPAPVAGMPRRRNDYSRLDAQQRTLARRDESRKLVPQQRFRGRRVLFINDINVTGAQQHCMSRYFDGVGAAEVHWLYLLDVDPAIGRSDPAIENVINSARHASFEEFAALVRGEDMDYTGKCLARLFSCSLEQLESLLPTLDCGRVSRILELTLREGAVAAEDFEPKLALVKAHAGALQVQA